MRAPAKKNGSAEGMRSRTRVCSALALSSTKRSRKPGSTLRRPRVVLAMIGNSATTVAHRISAACVFFTRMMTSGAMATIGVTCSITAYGNRLRSIARLCTKRKAVATPSTTASAKAASVTFIVLARPPRSRGRSAKSAAAIALGAGKR